MSKIEDVKVNWEKEYNKLVEHCKMLEQELMQEQEKNAKCKSNDTNYEVIRRLDIIGNMLGRYLRDTQLKDRKSSVEKLQKELEFETFDLHSREMKWSNEYEENLSNATEMRG